LHRRKKEGIRTKGKTSVAELHRTHWIDFEGKGGGMSARCMMRRWFDRGRGVEKGESATSTKRRSGGGARM